MRIAASPAAATVTTPGKRDGTGAVAHGIPPAQCATRNSHQSSGPVNRINISAACGQIGHSAAAAVPSTVIGAMTGVAARFATTATRLT